MMTKRWIAMLLAAATSLTPIAASAQGGGFGARILRDAGNARQDAPRTRAAPAARAERSESAVRAVPVPRSTASSDAPQFQRGGGEGRRGDGGYGRGNRGGNDGGGNRGGFDRGGGGNGRGQANVPAPAPTPAPVSRADRGPGPVGQVNRGGWEGRTRGDRGMDQGQRNYDRTPSAPPAPPVNRGGYDRDSRGQDDGRWQGRRTGGDDFGDRVIRDARRNDAGRYDRDGDRRYDRNDNGRYDRNRGYGDGRGYDRDRRWDDRRGDNGRNDRDRYDNRRNDQRGYDRDRWDNNRRWDRDWRRDNRYDWYGHRNRYRSLYRWPSYYSPYRNWSYRRLSIGFSLWPLFYSDQYWINDPWTYRLPEVYGPYRWVRYYDDALLVDLRTGEVVDVIHSFFW